VRGKEAILVACGLAVVGLLVFLALEVSRSTTVEVDADALARARADHQRLLAGRRGGSSNGDDRSDWGQRANPGASSAAVEAQPAAPPQAADRPSVSRLSRSFETRPPEPEPEPAPAPLDEVMDETNSLYDKADYEGALAAALEVLERDPGNVRMLRVVVSSGCILGENQVAEAHYSQLTAFRDRLHMRVRCKRFGLELPE